MSLTEDTIRAIVREEAGAAFDERLPAYMRSLGIDTENPVEVQQDHAFLRRQRVGTERIRRTALWAIVWTVVPAALWLLWEGWKARGG